MTTKDKNLAIGLLSLKLGLTDALIIRFQGASLGTACCLILLTLASMAFCVGVLGIEKGIGNNNENNNIN
jgi:hypothetical protein